MGAEQLEYAYAGDILKWDDNGDGTINVYGMATDPTVDLDGQSCDPEWLKSAMPDWFSSAANIREQHGRVAAGVGKELTHADGDKWMLKSTIVDPATVLKVKHGVLKGYSVGIREGKVLRGKGAGAPNGTIVGGKIVEVSLVDRPCNPLATINIAKAAPGSDELEAVEPEFVDIDPSYYGETAVPSDDDVDGEPDGDQGATADGEPAGGDDDTDDGVTLLDDDDDWIDGEGGSIDPEAQLSLFDDDDAPEVIEDEYEANVALLDKGTNTVTITKGLLESLLHGVKKPAPKKDGDGDGKTGENDAKKRAEQSRLNREHREREADKDRKARRAGDAEALRDANQAQRQGRRQEAGEHRGRLGAYARNKALELHEYRAGRKLVRLVLDGVIVKGAALDSDAEIVAELAELIAVEAGQVAMDGSEDVSDLLDACAAIAKMAGIEPTILKAAGLAVDESTATATLDVAEIVKAQVAEQLSIVREAHEAEVATLRAQVTKMAATPLPGGPHVGRMAMPSTPAQTPAIAKALELERRAADPNLSGEVQTGLLALAAAERAKG